MVKFTASEIIDELRFNYDKEIHFVYEQLIISKNTMGRDVQDWDLKVFLAKQYFNRLKEDATNSVLYMLKNRKGEEREIYRQKMEMLRDRNM
jgi:hypothetical protein